MECLGESQRGRVEEGKMGGLEEEAKMWKREPEAEEDEKKIKRKEVK